MATDSSQAGYLRPGTSPPYDAALEDIFQGVIVGVTGLPGRLVRPKYQPDPPNHPGFDLDWCAFSVYVEPAMWNSHRTLLEDGSYLVQGQEVLRVTTSFYGPGRQAAERSWREGLQLEQNRDALVAQKIAFIEFAEPVNVPVLLKEQWVKKVDVKGTFHRWAERIYPVRSLNEAAGTINTDGGVSVAISVTP